MKEHIVNIIYKELNSLPLTNQERDELSDWLARSASNSQVYSSLKSEEGLQDRLKRRLDWQESAEAAFARFSTGYSVNKIGIKPAEVFPQAHIPLFRRAWFRYAAAAILVLGIGAFLWNTRNEKPLPQLSVKSVPLNNDFAPGANRAILTLAGGGTIILDSASDGMLAQQGGVKVMKSSNGQIIYNPGSAEASTQLMLNTMSTPRGGQYRITLSDGTNVWLNAASSVTYPAVFAGDKRKISIIGEAYLEVAKNAKKPFVVQVGESEIEVLGTHFNINAYADEPALKTTLLEGKIKISKGLESKLLAPGEQAVINDGILIDRNIDTDLVMAWKNGLFEFRDQSVESIMRQVARWYNVSVVYDTKINYHFNASIPRSVPVSRLFHLLESTGMVHFSIVNNTIIVKS